MKPAPPVIRMFLGAWLSIAPSSGAIAYPTRLLRGPVRAPSRGWLPNNPAPASRNRFERTKGRGSARHNSQRQLMAFLVQEVQLPPATKTAGSMRDRSCHDTLGPGISDDPPRPGLAGPGGPGSAACNVQGPKGIKASPWCHGRASAARCVHNLCLDRHFIQSEHIRCNSWNHHAAPCDCEAGRARVPSRGPAGPSPAGQ